MLVHIFLLSSDNLKNAFFFVTDSTVVQPKEQDLARCANNEICAQTIRGQSQNDAIAQLGNGGGHEADC